VQVLKDEAKEDDEEIQPPYRCVLSSMHAIFL